MISCYLLNQFYYVSSVMCWEEPTRKKKMFKSKTFCIRILIVLILILLFTWWAGRAVFRYLSQPLATDIETSFGDNKIGIRFPLITFCPNIGLLKKNEIMKDCVDEQYIYLIPTVVACFQKYQNFKTGTLFITFQWPILNCQLVV